MEEKQEGRFAGAELEMAGVIRDGIGKVAKDDVTQELQITVRILSFIVSGKATQALQ